MSFSQKLRQNILLQAMVRQIHRDDSHYFEHNPHLSR
jgi:hypothetical protein